MPQLLKTLGEYLSDWISCKSVMTLRMTIIKCPIRTCKAGTFGIHCVRQCGQMDHLHPSRRVLAQMWLLSKSHSHKEAKKSRHAGTHCFLFTGERGEAATCKQCMLKCQFKTCPCEAGLWDVRGQRRKEIGADKWKLNRRPLKLLAICRDDPFWGDSLRARDVQRYQWLSEALSLHFVSGNLLFTGSLAFIEMFWDLVSHVGNFNRPTLPNMLRTSFEELLHS